MRINLLNCFLILLLGVLCSCEKNKNTLNGASSTTDNKMYVYQNSGKMLYLVDYQTYEVVRTINLNFPAQISCYGLCLSTDHNYLIGEGIDFSSPMGNLYFYSYDIQNERILNYFNTGLIADGIPSFIAANIPSDPGLAYFNHRSKGLYAFNFINKEPVEQISNETEQHLIKLFYHSSEHQWTVVNKKWLAGNSRSELHIYDTLSGLKDLKFILNEGNKDSVYIYDIAFSNNNKKLYISYQLSGGRSVGIAAYFGSYDLETRKLYTAPFTFPWSLNPYYMAYSPRREEVYLVGASAKFYIIDVSGDEYSIKDTIQLTGKVGGPSKILVRPDEEVAFVSCNYTNLVYVIDLETRSILNQVHIPMAYTMIIPLRARQLNYDLKIKTDLFFRFIKSHN